MGNRMLEELITFASELAVGQILILSFYNNIFYFSSHSRRVAGMDCKPLPAIFIFVITFISEVCGMWFTAKGRPHLCICLNY
jgi:hypothetical protein